MGVAPIWTVTVGDREFYLRDLPIGTLERITPSWSLAIAAPLMDLRIAEALYQAAHEHLGEQPRRHLSTRALIAAFQPNDDDLPSVWMDGIPDDTQRDSDAWIATLCRPPYCYTPRQVREEFTVRDLLVLRDAAESRDV
jgi:hypothetical protein